MTQHDARLKLQDRIILITGASRGLGAALASEFASHGAKLILVAKTQGALEAVDDHVRECQKQQGLPVDGAVLIPMDLTQGDHIDGVAANIYQRFGRLDGLIGNAAILGSLSPLSHYTPKEFQSVITMNLTVNYRLIRAMEPLLRQSKHEARALFISCEQANAPKPYWGAYAASKAGLQAMVEAWAQEVKQFNIKAGWIDPGPMATRLHEKAYPGRSGSPLQAPPPTDHATARCLDFFM
ncbi:MAG: SDR family NAD(P)-dependent oxidoreductase [Alphaproteobacteria bacterium]